jgi:hypothetical protein
MKMTIRFFAVTLSALFICSCLSMSVANNPVNSEFAAQTGVRFTFVLRGLYSTAREDARLEPVYSKLADNKLLFYVNAGQTETATFSDDHDTTAITFNSFLFELPEAERSIFVAAVISAIGLIDPDAVQNEDATALFYEVIASYNESGYSLPGINANEKINTRQITAFGRGLL